MYIKKLSSLLLVAMLAFGFGSVTFAEEGDTPDGQLPAGEPEVVEHDTYTLDPNAQIAEEGVQPESGNQIPSDDACVPKLPCNTDPEYAAGWNYVAGDYWYLSTGGSWVTKTTKVVTGKGGNFKVNIPAHTPYGWGGADAPVMEVRLYEDDPTGDDFIASWRYYPKGKTTTTSLSAYIANQVDGADGDAELYYKYSYNYKSNSNGYIHVGYYD